MQTDPLQRVRPSGNFHRFRQMWSAILISQVEKSIQLFDTKNKPM